MPRRSKGPCSIDGCARPAVCRGFCEAHYWRWRKYGDPLAGETPMGEPLRFLREVVIPYEGDDCLPWPFSRIRSGYGNMLFQGRMQIVPRIVCAVFCGPAPTPKHQAAHSCGRGHAGCVNPRHIRWATPLENASDKFRHGTALHGANHPSARLAEADVRRIRQLGRWRQGYKEIADQFGITDGHVANIVARRVWTSLGDDVDAA